MFPILDAPWAPVFIVVVFMLHPWLGVLSLIGAILLFAIAIANEIVTRGPLMRANGAANAALARVLRETPMYPGMQAEVMIVTGARTMLEYIMKPMSDSFNRAFREK